MKKILPVILFIVGLSSGLVVHEIFSKKPSPHKGNHEEGHHICKLIRNTEYKFISPLVECESENAGPSELIPFEGELEQLVNKLEQNNDQIAVYFRDLNNGPWFGVNEKATFTPASLFKLPAAISIYKASEENSALLSKEITYSEVINKAPQQNIAPEQTIEIGKTYTVAQLVEKMLVYSDNASTTLLSENLTNTVDFDKVFKDLNIDFDASNAKDLQISAKSFASLYRILFNATYLNTKNSEQILQILSRSHEEKTLFEGPPESITIAAKFGERAYANNNTKFLHNCGIIYYPKHPYLLCIMTKGENSEALSKDIQEISKFIYKQVETQYRGEARNKGVGGVRG